VPFLPAAACGSMPVPTRTLATLRQDDVAMDRS
jgi:hypothetical protein